MNLTKEKTKNAIMCARKVLDQAGIFKNNRGKIPISIDAVTDYIARHCKVDITIREVNFAGVHLKGRQETYKKGKTIKVIIDIRSDLPTDWKRFVALKELMHVLVDKDEEDLTPYGDLILDELVLEGHIGVLSDHGDSPPAQSELVAEVAAIEVIYPMNLRRGVPQKIQDPKSNVTISKISLQYEAPEPIISTALSASYINFVKAALK